MARNEKRIRVERGLYKAGDQYLACVTPPGSRQARWKTLGRVGLIEARRMRDQFAVDVRTARHMPAENGRATFGEVAGLWLEQQSRLVAVGELSPRTLSAYEGGTRLHLLPYFGHRKVRSLLPDHLVAWHAEQRLTGGSAWSIKGRWTALTGILGYAARNGFTEANVADALTRRERPKPGESRKRILNDDEMGRLLGRAARRYRPLIAVLLFGGLRISEALGLTWDDVDRAEGVIRVRFQLGRDGKRKRLKTGAGARDVVMMKALSATLRELELAAQFSQGSDFVFATAARTSISQRNAARAFARATGAAARARARREGKTYEPCGLEDITFHALRHTFASMLIGQGRDVVFVSDQLGHEDPGFTLRTYAHLFRAAKEQADAREQLDAEYGGMLRGLGS